jgi:hypothetical protein
MRFNLHVDSIDAAEVEGANSSHTNAFFSRWLLMQLHAIVDIWSDCLPHVALQHDDIPRHDKCLFSALAFPASAPASAPASQPASDGASGDTSEFASQSGVCTMAMRLLKSEKGTPGAPAPRRGGDGGSRAAPTRRESVAL